MHVCVCMRVRVLLCGLHNNAQRVQRLTWTCEQERKNIRKKKLQHKLRAWRMPMRPLCGDAHMAHQPPSIDSRRRRRRHIELYIMNELFAHASA